MINIGQFLSIVLSSLSATVFGFLYGFVKIC